jgi:MFS transporter, ACS family, glucarate transporter
MDSRRTGMAPWCQRLQNPDTVSSNLPGDSPLRYRNRVLGLLSLLIVITYLDRICISVAGPRIQDSLHLGPQAWGWVTGIFTVSYALFEIPTGALGDRIGPRRVLTRVVLWWSAFTSITGLALGYRSLLTTRFLFGAGEAGAFPNTSIVVARWFPVHERGRAFGIILAAAQTGGAISPLLVVPIQMRYGWRASFYIFGLFGVAWSAIWYTWFRDSPPEKPGVSQAELDETHDLPGRSHRLLPWGIALRSANFWATMGVAFCYIYTFNFFQTWFHTYLVRARGFSEKDLLLSSLPFILAGCANLAGGLASHLLVRRIGLKWGRCGLGVLGLAMAAVCTSAVIFTHSPLAALTLLSFAYAAICLQQPIMFAVCLDIGGAYAGAMVGAMNTASQIGSFSSSLAFGYLVGHTGNYNLPFLPMAAFLVLGAWLWLRIDPTEHLTPLRTMAVPVALPLQSK